MEVILLIFGIGLYFLPSLIGHNKRNIGAIFMLNLILGWTFVGWIVALIWACTKDTQTNQPVTYTCKHCKFVSPVYSAYCHRCLRDTDGFTLEQNKEKYK